MATWFVTPLPPPSPPATTHSHSRAVEQHCHFCAIAPHLCPYLLQSDHALPPPVHPPRPPPTYLHWPNPQLRPLLQGTIYAQAVECKNPCGPPGGKMYDTNRQGSKPSMTRACGVLVLTLHSSRNWTGPSDTSDSKSLLVYVWASTSTNSYT